MSRQSARESVMKIIFESEFNSNTDTGATIELMEPVLTENDRLFVDECSAGVFAHLDDLDAVIERFARGWSMERIAKVDKSILRLAIYEVLFTQVPEAVVINEAVNMAKTFSTDDSAAFVNGILGSFSRSRDPQSAAAPNE